MTCLLHIGTHKTGTTSIQHFLRHHVGAPTYPVGLVEPDHHTELADVAARPERIDLAAMRPETSGEQWRAMARAHIRAQVTSDVDRLIYSAENLSLLCHADEVASVMDLLAGRDVQVVMYVRNPADFLEVYAVTMSLWDLPPTARPDAITDFSPRSWLVDYQTRIDLWAQHAPVTVIDYDEVVAADGSVIPSMASLVGVAPHEYRLNTTAGVRDALRQAIAADPAARAQVRAELTELNESQQIDTGLMDTGQIDAGQIDTGD
jgi:hypothetical protein